jgi:hypothetical protein
LSVMTISFHMAILRRGSLAGILMPLHAIEPVRVTARTAPRNVGLLLHLRTVLMTEFAVTATC